MGKERLFRNFFWLLHRSQVPIIVLAIFVHPYMAQNFLIRVLWALSVYIEALSVLPQLCFMRNAKVYKFYYASISLSSLVKTLISSNSGWHFFQMIEPFTAHYVFALGVSRFLACAYWIIQVSLRILGFPKWII